MITNKIIKSSFFSLSGIFIIGFTFAGSLECGGANGVYSSEEEEFRGVFCIGGDIVGEEPDFPEIGNFVEWSCESLETSVNCVAEREISSDDGQDGMDGYKPGEESNEPKKVSLGNLKKQTVSGIARLSSETTIHTAGSSMRVSIHGDNSARFNINGGTYKSSGNLSNGDEIQLKLTPPDTHGTTVKALLEVGHITYTFSLTTVSGSDSDIEYDDGRDWDSSENNGEKEYAQGDRSFDEEDNDWNVENEENVGFSSNFNEEKEENIEEDRNEPTEIEKTSVYDEKDLEDNEKNLEKPEESIHDSFENEGEIQEENEDIKEKQPSKEQEKKVEGLNLEYTQYDKLPKDLGIKYNMYASRDLYNITNYMSYMEPTLKVVSWTEKKTKSYLDSLRVTTIKYLLGKKLSDKEERLFKIYRSRIGEHTIQTEKKDFGRYFKLQLSTENPALKLVQKLLDKEINKNMKLLDKNQIPKAYRLRNHLMILLLTIVEQDGKNVTTRAKKQAVDVVKQMAKLGII